MRNDTNADENSSAAAGPSRMRFSTRGVDNYYYDGDAAPHDRLEDDDLPSSVSVEHDCTNDQDEHDNGEAEDDYAHEEAEDLAPRTDLPVPRPAHQWPNTGTRPRGRRSGRATDAYAKLDGRLVASMKRGGAVVPADAPGAWRIWVLGAVALTLLLILNYTWYLRVSAVARGAGGWGALWGRGVERGRGVLLRMLLPKDAVVAPQGPP